MKKLIFLVIVMMLVIPYVGMTQHVTVQSFTAFQASIGHLEGDNLVFSDPKECNIPITFNLLKNKIFIFAERSFDLQIYYMEIEEENDDFICYSINAYDVEGNDVLLLRYIPKSLAYYHTLYLVLGEYTIEYYLKNQ